MRVILEKKIGIVHNLLLFICFLIVAASFILNCLPHLGFKYDIDPSDGDFLNAVVRLSRGMPIYGDWGRGDIHTFYPPLYFGWLFLAKLFRLDPIVFGRISNVVFIALSVLLVWLIVQRIFETNNLGSFAGALATNIMLSKTSLYAWAVNIKTDSLLLLLQLMACLLVCLRPKKIILISLITILAILTKQMGIGLGVALALYYLLHDRKLLKRYLFFSFIFFLLVVIPMEIFNEGNFLIDNYVYPNKVIVNDYQLKWGHMMGTISSYYYVEDRGGWLFGGFLFILLISGIYSTCRKKLKTIPLIPIFLIDLLIYLKIGRNTGGGGSYLWFHWALVSIFVTTGAVWLYEILMKYLRIFISYFTNLKLPAFEIILRSMTVILLLKLSFIVADFNQKIAQYNGLNISYRHLNEVALKHQTLISQITLTNPKEKWYTDRLSMAVVRAGNILDQEATSFEYAFRVPNLFKSDQIIQRFGSGEYRFIQKSGSATIPAIEPIIGNCYKTINDSETVSDGRVSPVKILEYKGCK